MLPAGSPFGRTPERLSDIVRVGCARVLADEFTRGSTLTNFTNTGGDSVNERCPTCGQTAPWCWNPDFVGLTCWKCRSFFSAMFAGSSATRVYHQIHCEKLMKVMPGGAVGLATNADAQRRGYRPCERCNPLRVRAADERAPRLGHSAR